ncbi:RING finger 32 [Heracleum sosnowskyi]|uniref:RING finger 32 n=1 Tax=Heracleum sosnowskyi TaxID=360622 RepID=A0AAD8MV51_9APIA|nr:RING finger 32 [Heracleum sosnowskyi]
MGGLCCVASRPYEENSGKGGREHSMDLVEPQWRTNFSYSPPDPSRLWDCRLQTDTLSSRHGHLVNATSNSSFYKERRIVFGGGRRTNHHHSVSDGALSYSGSQPDGQAPWWTSPIQKFNMDGFSTPSIRGKMSSRPEIAWVPQSSERQHVADTYAASCSYGSPFSLSESGPGDLTGRQPSTIFQSRNFPSRCSFMSKPVYPVLIHNPVSDCDATAGTETCTIGRLTPDNDKMLPLNSPDNMSTRVEQEFQTVGQLQEMDTSPDPSSISRREGYRWSTSSSYDMEFEAEQIDISGNMDVESLRSPGYQMDDTKCGICVKFLRQKSPWGSNRIMRSGDFPVAGILPCSHVFHAECLEQVTPKSQMPDPPCPLCLGSSADSSSFSEPLIMALRSVRRRGVAISDTPENLSIDGVLNYMKDSTLKIPSTRSNKFRKHLSSKGKSAKKFFSAKVFRRT